MGKVVTVHSYKGGTGKTIILTNLAAIYANKGKNVCILDLDLRAPSLGITFQRDEVKGTINDFLEKRCEINDVVFDNKQYATPGRFLVGLADHSPKAIQEILVKDRKWKMNAFQRIISLKNTLFNDMEMDYLLLDTSPGLQYSSINAVCIADIVLSVTVFDESDLDGTKKLIQNIYEKLEKRVGIILNKVPQDFLKSDAERKRLFETINTMLEKPLLTIIPCYCDVLQSKRSSIFALENSHGPFTKLLYELSELIMK